MKLSVTLLFFGGVVVPIDDHVLDDIEHQFEGIHDFQTSAFLLANERSDNCRMSESDTKINAQVKDLVDDLSNPSRTIRNLVGLFLPEPELWSSVRICSSRQVDATKQKHFPLQMRPSHFYSALRLPFCWSKCLPSKCVQNKPR